MKVQKNAVLTDWKKRGMSKIAS